VTCLGTNRLPRRRADLLRRLGRSADAKEAYTAAIAAIQNSAERADPSLKRDELT
jgi:RNA polymerase sigma-70 factor (ECF subfamily)